MILRTVFQFTQSNFSKIGSFDPLIYSIVNERKKGFDTIIESKIYSNDY